MLEIPAQTFQHEQSPSKHWAMLAFAQRVADGRATDAECSYMSMLAAADIPKADRDQDEIDALWFNELCEKARGFPQIDFLEEIYGDEKAETGEGDDRR